MLKTYENRFHPQFFNSLDDISSHMNDVDFSIFYELFQHELDVLKKDPYTNSRECKYEILREKGLRTMTFHSKLPRVGTGNMRIIFKIEETSKLILFYAVGMRINTKPRPEDDIYSKVESLINSKK